MKSSFKILLATVMLLAVICAGAAFAADTVQVEFKMGKRGGSVGGDSDPIALPGGELRLWVTRGSGFRSREELLLIDALGHGLYVREALCGATSQDAGSIVWLTERNSNGFDYYASSGDVAGTNIQYQLPGAEGIIISADESAVSGDSVTIYLHGGRTSYTDNGTEYIGPSVVVISSDGGQQREEISIDKFPIAMLSSNDETQNGAVLVSFDVVVLSSDADLLLEQIEAAGLPLVNGSNIAEKDGDGKLTALNGKAPNGNATRELSVRDLSSRSSSDPLVVDIAKGVTELVVVSSDAQGIDHSYISDNGTMLLDPRDLYAYLREGAEHADGDEKTLFKFRPVIDASGTITYRMDDPGLLLVLKDRLGSVLHIDFDDMNTRFGWKLEPYSVKFQASIGGSGSSSSCSAGSFAPLAPLALAALAAMRRRRK